jgi:hypothetical protein
MKIIATAIVQEITRNVSKIGGHVNFKINKLYVIVDTFFSDLSDPWPSIFEVHTPGHIVG